MEWLLTLIPVALVVLVCGGLHMVMMRGMHGGHDAAAGHGGHLSATDPENGARPERPIKLVRHSGQTDAMLTYRRRPDNGGSFERVPASHHSDVAWRNDSRPGAAQGGSDDDSNQ